MSRHLLFDLLEIVRGERLLAGEVVVEAVIDDGADRDLGVRVEFLDRLRQHVGGVVADQFQAFRVAVGDDGDRRIALQRADKVPHLAIHLSGEGLLGQGFGNALGHVQRRGAVGIFPL
jgi:hypothetical protein